MADTDDWGGVAVNSQPKTDDWGGIPVAQPSAPKMPDTSGVQKMAKINLTVPRPDDEGSESQSAQPMQTPEQRLDTAMGMPITGMLKGGDKDVPIPPAVRGQYVKSIQNGTASSFSDFMQTTLHAVVPMVSRLAHPIDTAEKDLSSVGRVAGAALEGVGEGYEEGAIIPAPDNSNIGTIGATAVNAPFRTMASLFSGFQHGVYQAGKEADMPQLGKELALLPEELMGSEGVHMHLPKEVPRPAGPWDNLPGHEAVRGPTATAMGRPIDVVSSADIDQTIAAATKDKAPPPSDFKNVATVTGANETTLHVIYKETGVKPDQVFEDAKNNPEVADDVMAGKVPEAYEHLVEPKPEIATEAMQVTRDDGSKTFSVVDEEGEHVQGGFDSAEEARQYIEDKKEGAIPDEPPEWKNQKADEPITEKTAVGEQNVIPGAEKIGDRELAERQMEGAKQPEAAQKPADEGLFDVSGRGQGDLLDLLTRGERDHVETPVPVRPTGEVGGIHEGSLSDEAKGSAGHGSDQDSGPAPGAVKVRENKAPTEVGNPTSLYTFLKKNGGINDEGGNLASMGEKGLSRKKGMSWDDATQLAHEHGYFKERPSIPELQNLLLEKDAGRDHFRDQDIDRSLNAQEKAAQNLQEDPSYVEHYADSLGIDATKKPNETPRQFIDRLKKAIKEFHENEEGSAPADIYRKVIGDTIVAAEKFVGKLTGGLFEKLGNAYIKTFQPELMGDKARRADAYLAKYKAVGQEAENAFYRQHQNTIDAFNKMTSDQRMAWLYDHETGRWNEKDNPDHARYQALLDATFKAEKESIGADADKGYKENYLPHLWERPDEVKAFFNSDAMIKKYGKDGFTKVSTFKLVQDGIRAGFKLKTDNPESMLVARLLAGQDMIRTMDLLHDMESSGIAKKVSTFSIGRKIARTQRAIDDAQEKYKAASDKINDPRQMKWDFADPAVSKYMKDIQARVDKYQARIDALNKEKSENLLTPEQMKELKGGFKIIGPDSKAWFIHQEVAPLWKNAMEGKGLWENQGIVGDAYRAYTGGKAIWTSVKLGLSLFHPVHVAQINLASGIASMADHLIHGGKLSDLALRDTGITMGLTKDTFKGQDHPAVKAWQTAPEARTPEQQQMVSRMVEGGMKPTMSARDTIHFKENFDKAINGVGLNNLRLIGSAIQLPGKLMAPFFEHWIPGMKAEIYLKRYQDALDRDPSLETDAGRRGEMARKIAKDTDRTYGEMNNDVQFWNKNVRDSFNAAYISGGWKLAQLYNARGLLEPAGVAYRFAKTGEFSKGDITYQMLHAYTYTALTLATGAAINAMLGNPIGTAKDTVWDMVKNLVFPKTGDNNPDGSPIRLSQPAFAKEGYMLARDINTHGVMAGAGHFLYHQTLIPSIADTLNNRDFVGRKTISDPTDLHQWMNAGWDAVNPISLGQYEKADSKGSAVAKVAGVAGFPIAGAYIDQTAFEQKVLQAYSEQNPPKGDVYTSKLKADLKAAVASRNSEAQKRIEDRMKEEGMTSEQIEYARKPYTGKFVETAWKKLSAQDQRHLIESASEEEKKKFKVKNP